MLVNQRGDRYGVFIGTPSTGLVRMEWAFARFGQMIPCNWNSKQNITWLPSGSCPINYLVADAQNIIMKDFLEQSPCQWLLLIEQDNVIPLDCFMRFNEYMRKGNIPMVSGLYFTKSFPAEPLVYRGRGNSYYSNWKIGDLVWVDGVPTGCLLIHRKIIELLWQDSEQYTCGDPPVATRRVFHTPQDVWHDPESGWHSNCGTSDLDFCARIMTEKVLERGGWPKIQARKYPFLIDTNLFVGHIDNDGRMYPSVEEKKEWSKPPRLRANS